MKTIETDEEDAHTGGKAKDTFFAKAVGFKFAIDKSTDRILFLLTGAVKRCEVEIRGGETNIRILMGGFEQILLAIKERATMDNDCGEVEQHTADPIRMGLVLFASKEN